MMPQSIDTHPDAENIQISLIRKATIAKRISCTRSFSQSIIQLSRKAIMRANPKLNERELILTFIAYHYGAGLANRLREYLDQKAL